MNVNVIRGHGREYAFENKFHDIVILFMLLKSEYRTPAAGRQTMAHFEAKARMEQK